ncbi:Ig-like domain-containing protein [Aliikangiella sp. IMCC44359]|uniref:Ig-like domain-containing protein n=1 Tax=Aliikangiella sp. IMCC44359 TaxID=3459125 RepID=UPI00403AF2BC
MYRFIRSNIQYAMTAASLSLLLMLTGCDKDDDEENAADNTEQVSQSIEVVESIPYDDASAIELDTPISIKYAETIESSDLNLNFSMHSGNVTIAGEYAINGDTISFTPSNQLIPGTDYSVSVSGSLSNKQLEATSIDFTTTNSTPTSAQRVNFINSTPYDNASAVELNAAISVTYSEVIESSDLNLSFAVRTGGEVVPGDYNVSGDTIYFFPESELTPSTEYSIRISGTISDKQLEATNIEFTTIGISSAISIASSSPLDLSNNIALSQAITVTFSENVDNSDVSIDMQVTQDNNTVAGQTLVVEDRLVFTPSSPFNPGALIKVSVDESSDSQKQINGANWSFTTISTTGSICADFYTESYQLVTGLNSTKVTSSVKPRKGVELKDPVFNTCVVRMTDHQNENPNGFARAEYSRKQAFNANDTLLLALANDGFWHIYDANSGAYLKKLNGPASDADLRWDSSNPDLMYYTGTYGSMKVYELTVSSNTSRLIGNFTNRLPWSNAARAWTKAEGTSSADGRYWGMQVETENHQGLGLMVWDKDKDIIVGTWDFSDNGVGRPDHTSMSPSGEYIVASWDGNNFGTTAFSRDFSKQVKLHSKSEHSDLALLPNGNDAYVAVDYQSNAGDVFMVEIQTGVRTLLFESYIKGSATAFHFSGKAYKNPGWALVSTYGGSATNDGSAVWMHDKVFAVELKANPRILQIAHHHSKENGYWTEPHATVNQDFTRVVFNSNWEIDSDTNIDIYQVKLPEGAVPKIAPAQ